MGNTLPKDEWQELKEKYYTPEQNAARMKTVIAEHKAAIEREKKAEIAKAKRILAKAKA